MENQKVDPLDNMTDGPDTEAPDTGAHPHAELMAQYAEDAADTLQPWVRWEHRRAGVEEWGSCVQHPSWASDMKFRRKPRYLIIDGTPICEPLRRYPETGDKLFLVTLVAEEGGVQDVTVTAENREAMKRFVERRILHTTRSAAVLHAKTLLSFEVK